MTTLAEIAFAAGLLAEARMELHQMIREARENNESLRAIAQAAGMSHEQVRRICRTK